MSTDVNCTVNEYLLSLKALRMLYIFDTVWDHCVSCAVSIGNQFSYLLAHPAVTGEVSPYLDLVVCSLQCD